MEMWYDWNSHIHFMEVKIYTNSLKNHWQHILKQTLCILNDT